MELAPICTSCSENLTDWEGNVMVDNDQFNSGQIIGLRIICKKCTRQLDTSGEGKKFHSIWELSSIKKHPIPYFASITQNLLQESQVDHKWDADSVREMGFLVSLTLPYDEARLFLRFLNPSEWDYAGTYIKKLNEMHGKDADY